jgi:hypothetical protein
MMGVRLNGNPTFVNTVWQEHKNLESALKNCMWIKYSEKITFVL